jgi:hypothetical protein
MKAIKIKRRIAMIRMQMRVITGSLIGRWKGGKG